MSRFLTVLVLLATCRLAARQPSFDQWERLMFASSFDDAATLAVRAAKDEPRSSVWAFRAAEALARADRHDEAVRWLDAAGQRGYSGESTLRLDADLDPIRGHVDFDAAARRIVANAETRRERFRQAALDAEPTVVLPPRHDDDVAVPLLLVLHGTGGTGDGMARAWRSVAARERCIIVAQDALRPAGARPNAGY